ncbi:MAG: GNAT family N-acetyltransferase [Vicinamibacterales bacterium]
MTATALVTPRARLRPLGPGDLEAVHALWTDPDVRRYLWDDEVVTRERALDALTDSDAGFASRGYGLWGIAVGADDTLAGFCGARPSETGAPELLYGLRRRWWGRGLATECAEAVLQHLFERVECAEVVALTDPPNTASVRVMERLGMTFERRGDVHGLDTLFYRLRADTWRARRASAADGEAAGAPQPPAASMRLAGATIRPAAPADAEALWAILHPVIAAGETYAWPRDLSREAALALWHPPGGHTVVAELDGRIAGTYVLKANQGGPGAHVANCGYMVAAWARGRGLAEALCRHSLDLARSLGFRAMQFNSVVSTNDAAIRVWQRCGFTIVGTVPEAFDHPVHGLVAIHVMHRRL